MIIQKADRNIAKRQVTILVTAMLAVAQIVFLYLLVHVHGYAGAGILGALNAGFIVLLSSCSGLNLDSRLTLVAKKSPSQMLNLRRNFVRATESGF